MRIGISLGGIGALHDGLGVFAHELGRRIAAQAPRWRDELGVQFDFHLREKLFGLFGDSVGYLPVTRWQRLRHVQRQPYALWHALHQLVKTLPPSGTRVRLVTVHDLNYVHNASGWARWRAAQRHAALLARTDHVVAISRHTAAELARHSAWRGPVSVILNGVTDLSGAPQAPLQPPLAERPFLFHLSRMSPSKNPQAILGLAAAWPEMQFLMGGPPSDEARALKAANRLTNVHFRLGLSEAQKAWAYAHCSGFLFPSLAEGFGLPPVEAMHFGKPVFLARRSSLPEIGGDAASYFDDFAAGTMRDVVERGLAAAPARADAVRAHAARYDWDACAEAYLALYRRLLGLPG